MGKIIKPELIRKPTRREFLKYAGLGSTAAVLRYLGIGAGAVGVPLLFPKRAHAAVAHVANGTVVMARTNESAVSSVLTVAGGTNNVIIAGVIVSDDRTVTSCVWDPAGANQAMTSAGTAVDSGAASISCLMYLFTLVNPTAGATKNVTATFSNLSDECGIVSAHFEGVDQTTPVRAGTYNSNTGSSSTIAVTITSQADDVTVSLACGTNDGTPSTDKTLIGALGLTGFGPCMGMDRAAGAATVTHTWSNIHFSGGNAAMGLSLAAASGSPPPGASGVGHRRIQ